MFIPQIGDYISVRKGGQSADPFDIAGTVASIVYTANNAHELLSVIFENNPSTVYISPADEVQVH